MTGRHLEVYSGAALIFVGGVRASGVRLTGMVLTFGWRWDDIDGRDWKPRCDYLDGRFGFYNVIIRSGSIFFFVYIFLEMGLKEF